MQNLGKFQQLGLSAAEKINKPIEETEAFQEQKRLVLKDIGQQMANVGKSRALNTVANVTAPALIRSYQQERALRLQEQQPMMQAGLQAAQTQVGAETEAQRLAQQESQFSRGLSQEMTLADKQEQLTRDVEAGRISQMEADRQLSEYQFTSELDFRRSDSQAARDLQSELSAKQEQLTRDVESGRISQTEADRQLRDKEVELNDKFRTSELQFREQESLRNFGLASKDQSIQQSQFAQQMQYQYKTLSSQEKMFKDELDQNVKLLESEQDFQAAEAMLNRQHQIGMLDLDQTFQAEQKMIDQAFQQGLITEQQAFEARQSGENRNMQIRQLAQEKELFTTNWENTKEQIQTEQDFNLMMDSINYAQEQGILDDQQAFAKSMDAIQKAHELEVLDDEQAFTATQNKLDRTVQIRMFNAQQKFEENMLFAKAKLEATKIDTERQYEMWKSVGEFAVRGTAAWATGGLSEFGMSIAKGGSK